jgi:hypothetical protein
VVRGRRDTADRLLYVGPPEGTDAPRPTVPQVAVSAGSATAGAEVSLDMRAGTSPTG